MKVFCICLFFAFSASLAFSQIDTTEVPFVSYWENGDVYKFKITKIRRDIRHGAVTKNDTTRYGARLEVLDSTENSYTIKWNYENTVVKDLNIPSEIAELFSDYKSIEVIYKTSEVGDFIESLNWADIGELMNEVFDKLIETSGDDEETQEGIIKAIAPIRSIYSSKDGIEQLVLKELHYIHFPFGVAYSTVEPMVYTEKLPNMFGGPPINAETTIKVESVDFEQERCVLSHEMKLDPEDSRNMITTAFKKMGMRDKEMKEAMKNAKIEINDFNRYEYYYYPGIPIKIHTKRSTKMKMKNEDSDRTDEIIIELIDFF